MVGTELRPMNAWMDVLVMLLPSRALSYRGEKKERKKGPFSPKFPNQPFENSNKQSKKMMIMKMIKSMLYSSIRIHVSQLGRLSKNPRIDERYVVEIHVSAM